MDDKSINKTKTVDIFVILIINKKHSSFNWLMSVVNLAWKTAHSNHLKTIVCNIERKLEINKSHI
jgi:hypothetical protein